MTTSAKVRADEPLRALDVQKDNFLSQVSHELRTPMTSIRAFADILLGEDPVSEDERRRFMAIIHDESLRLTRLLDEILDISRLEAGTTEIAVEPVGADAALQRALDTVSPLAREKGVRVLPHAALGGIEVVANPDRLRQVLINLLSNAVKYNTAEDPEIRVDWHAGDRKLRIDVIDNGGGVNREEAEDIFSRFTRGSCAGHDQGAGLGLPISRAIMRRMGGDLLVEFNQDGSSFFRIHLPLVAQKTPAAPEAAAE